MGVELGRQSDGGETQGTGGNGEKIGEEYFEGAGIGDDALGEPMQLLDEISPGLADKINALSADERRRVVAKAALNLSQTIDGLEPSVLSLIMAASNSNTLSPNQVEELRAYAEAADDQYLSLQEQGTERSEWANWFAKARLATGLADAFCNPPADKAAEAVYELCFVNDDKTVVVALVEAEIRAIKN